jgi:hypothetical protein
LVKKDALPTFWKQVVDEGLFVAGSHERKYTGLQIFELLLERCGGLRKSKFYHLGSLKLSEMEEAILHTGQKGMPCCLMTRARGALRP